MEVIKKSTLAKCSPNEFHFEQEREKKEEKERKILFTELFHNFLCNLDRNGLRISYLFRMK